MRTAGGRTQRSPIRQPTDIAVTAAQQGIGSILDPIRNLGIGRPTIRWIIFEAAIFRRIVRGRDDDSIRLSPAPAAVVCQYGVRDHRRGREAVLTLIKNLDPV